MDSDDKGRLNQQLARLGAGDRSCAPAVFAALWPTLERFCSKWLRGAPEAEDCAQRAIARVFSQATAFDARRDATAWALELAMWECRTVRSQQRRSRLAPLTEAASMAAPSDPSQRLEQAELEAALGHAVNGLSAIDREAILGLLADGLAGDAASRKRRQRAVSRLSILWRRLHGED